MAAAQPESRDGAAQSAKPASETDPLSRFTCPVCLEVFEKPVQVPCGHVFCSACLQECLKPKKPVCGVCRSALAPGVRAVELERQIESIETSCHGCRKNFILSKIRAHVTSCSKYQNYIMEGVKATTKDASLQPRNIPNRYTFPCPYCPEKNFDQEGLVEHCKLTAQHRYQVCGLSHLCLDAPGETPATAVPTSWSISNAVTAFPTTLLWITMLMKMT
uniref:E3 ubiquitin-protein ligase RNF114 n=1 Tax=Mus musculus TaxID=10090 RepID=Q8C521_MOUSE|nr:unnamed protein product [Mus musculus]